MAFRDKYGDLITKGVTKNKEIVPETSDYKSMYTGLLGLIYGNQDKDMGLPETGGHWDADLEEVDRLVEASILDTDRSNKPILNQSGTFMHGGGTFEEFDYDIPDDYDFDTIIRKVKEGSRLDNFLEDDYPEDESEGPIFSTRSNKYIQGT